MQSWVSGHGQNEVLFVYENKVRFIGPHLSKTTPKKHNDGEFKEKEMKNRLVLSNGKNINNLWERNFQYPFFEDKYRKFDGILKYWNSFDNHLKLILFLFFLICK